MNQKKEDTNILIVDDEPANIKVLMTLLADQGYEVRTALSGSLAISSAKERTPDLILLDVRMPDMDGFEVCRQLKEAPETSAVPVIFISALGETQDIVQGLTLGGADYITKPFRMDEVLARVETHLSVQTLQKQLKDSNERLRKEIKERQKADKNLRQLNSQLEQIVIERTARLHAQTIDLMKAKEMAESATIAKSKFLSNLSHELRTPLNPIMGYAQILKTNKNLTDVQKDQLQIICDSGTHLTSLISDMLELVRIDTHPEEVENTEFNLRELLHDVIRDTKEKALKKSLAVVFDEEDVLPSMVCGDSRMLHHVLLHLLDNAIKFTDGGGVLLHASAESVSSSGGKQPFRFEVIDTGIGISPEIIDNIYDPFFQGEIDGRLVDGTGLGLTLCKRMVGLMGGRLSAQSPYPEVRGIDGGGPGSIFTVEIDFESVGEDTFGTGISLERPSAGDLKGKRVLIVDDNLLNLNLLVHALELMGFDIDKATNGRQAVKRVRQNTPDLILLDFLMPGMDGDEVLAEIRSQVDMAHVKVIGVSAAAENESQVKSFADACDDYLEKPVNIKKLQEIINKQLGIE